jgi:sugar phosphate permease
MLVKLSVEEDKEKYFLFDLHSIAIPTTYFAIGVVSSFVTNPLNIYMVQALDADPTIQTTIKMLETIPWSFKIIFGFVSDAFPIFGMNRKPYLMIGMILWSSFLLVYSVLMSENVFLLSLCVIMSQMGLLQMDVMVDTLLVIRSKQFESEEDVGGLQSTCYALKYSGQFLGAILGTILCNEEAWGWGLSFYQISFLLALIPPILIVPFLYR